MAETYGSAPCRLLHRAWISNPVGLLIVLLTVSKVAEGAGFAPATAYSSAGVFETLSSSIRTPSKVAEDGGNAPQPAHADPTHFQCVLNLVQVIFHGGEKGIRTLDRLFIGRRFQNAFLVYPGSLRKFAL